MSHRFLLPGGFLFLAASTSLNTCEDTYSRSCSASSPVCDKFTLHDLRATEGTRGVSWFFSDSRKMASEWQDGLLALSEIRHTSAGFSFPEESNPSTRKSQ